MSPTLLDSPRRRGGCLVVFLAALVLLVGARTAASYVIDYQWWKELGQLPTWFSVLLYGVAPVVMATVAAFLVLWTAHARGMKFAGTRLREHPLYAKISTVALLVVGLVVASSSIDSWTVVRYFGGRHLPVQATSWQDPVFGQPLAFYLFLLPFYSNLLSFVLALALVAGLLFWLTARGWQLREQMPQWMQSGEFDLRVLGAGGALEASFLRMTGVVFLLALAGRFYLERYAMLLNEHGFLVGIDYVNENIGLPLQWLVIAAAVVAAVAVSLGRGKIVLAMLAALLVRAVVPTLVNSLYVKPNEISIQKPYVQRHIQATRSAYHLNQRVQEVDYAAKTEAKIDITRNKALLDNVRLWDLRAFHDTVTQIQAIRPYYVFANSDVDRYTIDGQLRQLLVTPREMDIRQLSGAGAGWINTQFIYTHGYGVVVAEANRITPEGLPVLFIQNAPPEVKTASLKLTRPEIYYGEVAHEPVFVRTAQPEFDYPAGSDNKHTRYEGRGGFPIHSFSMRLAAAVARGDWDILLTSMLTPESRMMIHRKVIDRLQELAGFVTWDGDPYLVITSAGRLVWMVDGYTTSDLHPYSRLVDVEGVGRINYIRNSVKATVDAYDGEARLYVFDPADPIIQAYQNLFPKLLLPASEMPADLRRHARYPETLFRVQAEIYRTFHMRDPETFYNKEDLWDLTTFMSGQGDHPQPASPTYVVATVPGEERPEFLLILPFTPRNKINLIGMMVARCDGEHLGELLFLRLSKQAMIYGPMQIEAKINQDQTISKDLTLWNQQGSQVLRGQMLVLPIQDTFLYVQPIYIQASHGSMPQLKKVALAVGDTIIYQDTYEQALAELGGLKPRETAEAATAPRSMPATPATGEAGRQVDAVRRHLRRFRELNTQGKWAEAGKELEALESELGRK
jgi:uncharacterized membrane protein (UPF0182 family)